MLSGSTLLRVAVLFVVAAALAGVVQAFWPQGGDDPAPGPQVQRTEPAKLDPSKLYPANPDPSTSETRAAQAPPARETAVAAQPASPPPAPAAQPVLPPSPIRPLSRPAPPPAGAEVQTNAAIAPAPSPGRAAPLAESPPLNPVLDEARNAGGAAAGSAGPRAVSVVDLNTASLAELNALKGGGLIGKAIVQRRPYTSVDQLLSKRVLSRSTYDRIKDQLTVQ